MDFDFSEDQKALKDEARRALAAKCDLKLVREALDGSSTAAVSVWEALVELGWFGAAISEEYGGLGLGYLELCILAEEMGRALVPAAFSSSIYLAAEAMQIAGSEEQKKRILPDLASGEQVGVFSVAEGVGPFAECAVNAVFKNGALSGNKMPVADGGQADFAIVAAKNESMDASGEIVLCKVKLEQSGVTRTPLKTIDPTRAHAKLKFDNAQAEILGGGKDGWSKIEAIADRAAILFAFEQLGGADRCLEIAQEYASDRYSFARPIGSFQAIKHRMADMFIKNELARGHAYYGAWALSMSAPELTLAAAGARVSAIDAYEFASKETMQIHGGIGITWEVDCHMFHRRAKLLASSIGSRRYWADRLVDCVIAENGSGL